jgi:hypothetical protein
MRRIPEKFELTEQDIKTAIAYWLNHEVEKEGIDFTYNVDFRVERRETSPPKGAPVGGMTDYSVQVISAVAEKKG